MELKFFSLTLGAFQFILAQDTSDGIAVQPSRLDSTFQNVVIQTLDTQTVNATVAPKIISKPAVSNKMDREEMRLVPGSLSDPMRSILTLPGVEASNDVSVLPYVRGGDWLETRVFWNEVPLLNAFHSLSAFSVFTMEGTESIDLNMGYLPARGNGSLSGSIWVNPRAPKDSLRGKVSLDLMRTGFWFQTPFLDEWNVDVSGQTFYYDYTQKAVLKTTAYFGNDSAYKANVDQYAKLVKLPTFYDGALILRRNSGMNSWEISSLWAGDRFHVLNQTQNFTDFKSALNTDTLAQVYQSSLVEKLAYQRKINSNWLSKSWLAWQMNDWDVQFDDDNVRYDQFKQGIHARSALGFANDTWTLETGLSWDTWTDRYESQMPRTVYKLLMEASPDPMDLIGQFSPNGFVFSSNSEQARFDEVMGTLEMNYKGDRSNHELAFYSQASHQLNPIDKLEAGLRIEQDYPSGQITVSPRLAWAHLLDRSSQIGLSSGVYTQKDYPFYYRDANPDLLSEKSWQSDLEYQKTWGNKINIKASLWAKKYWDLVSIKIKPISSVLINLDSLSYDELSASKFMQFDNQGRGYAYGSELSSDYHPLEFYRGRISAELGLSRRGDDLTEEDYSFAHFRDWKLKWFHHFQFGPKHSIGVRFSAGRGFPYTGFWSRYTDGDSKGDTSLIIESRLNRHFSSYRRLDIRFAHTDTFFGLATESYFEIWNAWNSPNFALRDEETMKIRSFDFNTPIPFFFGGWEIKF